LSQTETSPSQFETRDPNPTRLTQTQKDTKKARWTTKSQPFVPSRLTVRLFPFLF